MLSTDRQNFDFSLKPMFQCYCHGGYQMVWVFYFHPYRVFYSAYFESWEIVGPFTSHTLFNGLMLILQVLHIIWFYMICRMVYAYIVTGQVMIDRHKPHLSILIDRHKPRPFIEQYICHTQPFKIDRFYEKIQSMLIYFD